MFKNKKGHVQTSNENSTYKNNSYYVLQELIVIKAPRAINTKMNDVPDMINKVRASVIRTLFIYILHVSVSLQCE